MEGYPESAGAVPAGFLFNGALSTYDRLGFTRDRMIGKHRWVVSRVVEPALRNRCRHEPRGRLHDGLPRAACTNGAQGRG